MAELKRVYTAPTEDIALSELETFDETWSGKYPKIAKSWRDSWANLSTYFKYPEGVGRLIYTTNTIEGFNRQLRKVTKSKTVFPSDDSLILKNAYANYRQKSGLIGLARSALLDMSRNCIIIQTRENLKNQVFPSVTNNISYISS